LPLPLAYTAGWWIALRDAEKQAVWGRLGNGLAGVGAWYEEDALQRVLKPGLDARLDWRFRCDPPEFVTVFTGNSDGSHWGLWYDEPRELPTIVVHNWARDTAETGTREPTLLASFREHLEREEDG
jgi:hypothetical protein